jgi:hypothetical protein
MILPLPYLLPPSVSKLDQRDILLTEEWGRGVREEPNLRTARSLALYKSFNTLWPIREKED